MRMASAERKPIAGGLAKQEAGGILIFHAKNKIETEKINSNKVKWKKSVPQLNDA